MDATATSLASGLVDAAYIAQGVAEIRKRDAAVRALLAHRNLPDHGWDDDTVEHFLRQLALMDSNNFTAAVGAGEREARIFSGIVRRRHWGFGHGIGRSGDVAAVQPKAAGESHPPPHTHSFHFTTPLTTSRRQQPGVQAYQQAGSGSCAAVRRHSDGCGAGIADSNGSVAVSGVVGPPPHTPTHCAVCGVVPHRPEVVPEVHWHRRRNCHPRAAADGGG